MRVGFGVLGPVTAWDEAERPLALRGPRHRAVLARLIVARRRVVPVELLIEDLWQGAAPPGATSAVRTFVAALRRALEPDRPPRAPAALLTTQGPGYALRAAPDTVDAWLFEQRFRQASALSPAQALPRLQQALEPWRGPAYADFADAPWARTERARLAELRLHALERLARARLDLGQAAQAVPDLDAHVAEHPWREDAWRLLALALYRTGRQGEALAVLRRSRALLVEQLGVDPGPALSRLEQDILHQAEHLIPEPAPEHTGDQLWTRAAAAYQRTVTPGARVRLESTVGLLREMAVTGPEGLRTARSQRLAAVTAAEELGDPRLTARVIGAYDVPANWTRVDDPDQSARVVAAAERTLAALPGPGHEAARARLLATVALESRGSRRDRGSRAATEAERLARDLGDPTLLAFALNARYMQTFHRTGLAPERDALGAELLTLADRHDLVTFQILGHLVRLQSRAASADWPGADHHAQAAQALARHHERPLAEVFTTWYRALRTAADPRVPFATSEAAYRGAADRLHGAGMPGLEQGLYPLALLCLCLHHDRPAPTDPGTDHGPHEPWARPHVLLAQGRRAEAAAALAATPEPPRDLLLETRWALTARAALALDDRPAMHRALAALTPAAGEIAGAQTGMLILGPVDDHLRDLNRALHA
ncbi:BTAD domain-containing putative transcriptional regulator [Nocardiopsis terrae]